MTGKVDDKGRALLPITLRPNADAVGAAVEAWVDTAFDGDLVLSQELIAALGLETGYGMRAILADGSEVEVKTYAGQVDWFGTWRTVEVIANDGRVPLLGVGLLVGRVLRIDYAALTLALD